MVKIRKGHEECIVPTTAFKELYALKGWERVDEPIALNSFTSEPESESTVSKKGRRRGADKNDSDTGA